MVHMNGFTGCVLLLGAKTSWVLQNCLFHQTGGQKGIQELNPQTPQTLLATFQLKAFIERPCKKRFSIHQKLFWTRTDQLLMLAYYINDLTSRSEQVFLSFLLAGLQLLQPRKKESGQKEPKRDHLFSLRGILRFIIVFFGPRRKIKHRLDLKLSLKVNINSGFTVCNFQCLEIWLRGRFLRWSPTDLRLVLSQLGLLKITEVNIFCKLRGLRFICLAIRYFFCSQWPFSVEMVIIFHFFLFVVVLLPLILNSVHRFVFCCSKVPFLINLLFQVHNM